MQPDSSTQRSADSSAGPLADLHRHLDGSLRAATLEELARQAGRLVPADLTFQAGMGLEAALLRFAFTLSFLQTPENVRRIAAEICEDALADGVTTLEIRFAPQLHLEKGARVEEIVDAALEGIAGRAGLILCGLYGEPLSVLVAHVEIARTRTGVVGIDIAGGPSSAHEMRLEDYAPAFQRAEALGLGRTVHAAEGRSPHEIRIAIETLFAQRIGHGTTLLEDNAVVDLVCERNVVIEACPTSNLHTGVISSVSEHPLPRWLERGVRACVCTDNTLLSAIDARRELQRVAAIPGMTDAKLARVIEVGHAAAFSIRTPLNA